jgi:thiamine-phosphate pyrophosphorylase
LARSLNLPARRTGLPALVLVTDDIRLADPLAALAHLPTGSWVILRHYAAENRSALGHRLARACRAQRLTLLVAGDLDLAVALGAGLHLPEGVARGPLARIRLWRRKKGALLTCAAHTRPALRRAAAIHATAAFLSPVFPTLSHPGAKTLGPQTFRRLVRGADLPVYALGGVTSATIGRLAGSGAVGIAGIGGLSRR